MVNNTININDPTLTIRYLEGTNEKLSQYLIPRPRNEQQKSRINSEINKKKNPKITSNFPFIYSLLKEAVTMKRNFDNFFLKFS